jgi:hypothetical protein
MAIGPRQLEQLPIPTLMPVLLRPADSSFSDEVDTLRSVYASSGLQGAIDNTMLSMLGQIMHRERQAGRDIVLHEELAEEVVRSSFDTVVQAQKDRSV